MREQIAATIKNYEIPRSTVAKLSGLWLTDLSAWLNGRQQVNSERQQRIAQTVADIVRVIETMPCKLDLRDPENVRRLIVAVNDATAQMQLEFTPPDASLEDLRIKGTESGAAA